MTANISKDAKIASIHLPAGRSAMAGVLSYLGIEHKDENDLSCCGSNELGIQVTLEYNLIFVTKHQKSRSGGVHLSVARSSNCTELVKELYIFKFFPYVSGAIGFHTDAVTLHAIVPKAMYMYLGDASSKSQAASDRTFLSDNPSVPAKQGRDKRSRHVRYR